LQTIKYPGITELNAMKFFKHILILFYALSFFLLPAFSPAGEIDELSSKAEQGHVEAQFKLADAYYSGTGTRKNPEQAFFWYEKAAQQGHPKAQRALGAMYELGKGTAKEPEQAAFWYEKAAEQGLARAQTNLGILYETGEGVAQNHDTARMWYEKAAEQGYARGQTYLGRMYELSIGVAVDYTKAFYWYEKAAEQGYARAQTNLGALYEAGQGVEQNYEQAVVWYTKAAQQRYARGQFYLGRMFEQGLGVEKDLAQASIWYTKAAELGHIRARQQLAKVQSEHGKTDEKIKEEKQGIADQAQVEGLTVAPAEKEEEKTEQITAPAKDKYLAAVETGDPDSQNSLALLYLNGSEGYARDAEKAAYWFRRAAENGSVAAQNNLGLLYMNGEGVEKDQQEAMLWLQKAAEAGIVEAQSNLGQKYYFEENYQEAAFWLLQAAKQGLANAQNNLAVMYSDGLGVEQNKERAKYWLQKAADQGDPTARQNLTMLIEEQTEASVNSLMQSDSQGPPSSGPATANNSGATASMPVTESKQDFGSLQAATEHFHKGNLYAEEGQFISAISEYKRAIELDPNNSNTYENLAIALAKTGNFKDALKIMQTAIRLSPDDAMKYATLGIIYHADNKLQEALEQYIKSVRLNPGHGEMYYNMAMIYSELGQFESAYKCCLQAQSLGYAGSFEALVELQKIKPELSAISDDQNVVLNLRHIVTSTAAEAELVLGRLHGGEDFIQLASQYSLPPFNLNGGYLGPYDPKELIPVISEVVVPLTPLAFSPVIETSTGFHIFQKFMVGANLLASQ
jgi:TPR repeat protein